MNNNIHFNQTLMSLGPSHFDFNIDDGNSAIKWRNWLRGFELFAKASGINDDSMKTEWMLTCAGPKVQDVYFNLPDRTDEKEQENKGSLKSGYVSFEKDKYKEAILKLENFFAPKRHVSFERHVFRQIQRKPNERVDSLIMRLRIQADRCDFGNQLDENIKDQITIGCNSELLRRKILEKGDESLESIIKMARVYESVTDQQKLFADGKQTEQTLPVPKSQDEVCKIETLHRNNNQSPYRNNPKYRSNQTQSSYNNNQRKISLSNYKKFNSRNDECSRCGFLGHKAIDQNCPAKGKTCNGCGGIDHFARKCFKRNDDNYEPQAKKIKHEPVRLIKATSPVRMIQNSSRLKTTIPIRSIQVTNDKKLPIKTTKEVNIVHEYDDIFCIFPNDNPANRIWCNVGGIELEAIVDSGTRYNIIDRETWMELQSKNAVIIKFQTEIDIGFKGYGGYKLNFVGMIEAVLQIKDKETVAKFYVANEVGQFLIGWETGYLLKILKIGVDVNNIEMANTEENIEQETSNTELSKIKGILVEIPIEKNVKPVQQPYRRVPVPIEKIVDEKIDIMLREGIIEKVKTSRWISPLVMQPKPDGDVRVCVDMRLANEAIVREYHPLPTIEEFLPYLGSATFFSKIDVRQAFHQAELAPNSREITTFITKKGLFRYKRLMFGINCAPEIFQKIMEQILSGCEGCCIFMDDVLIHGETKDIHDKNLTEVIERLREFNVTLNDKKCIYGVNSVIFLGHKLSEKGIQPTDDKVNSIKRFRAPETVEEVRSFLGLVNYVGKFIPNLATIAEPLRQLTRNESTFVWTEQQQQAFDVLKAQLTKETTLGYYNVRDRTRIIADASPTGLGAVLVQFQQSGPRVISYASRSLTQTERKYAQPEKEALALVWAVERFHFYIFGREVELVTDHQSLEKLFSPKSHPCARIERWVLRLQSYKYKIIYQPGKTNIADPLSRLVNERSNTTEVSTEDEEYIRWVIAQAEPKAIKQKEIAEASRSDKAILAVKNGIYDNDWTSKEAVPYKHFETEFCFVEDILLRSNKIVLPECLWQRAMDLSHEGHPGMSVMKKRLRAKVWWPKMDQHIESFVRRCKSCTLVSAPPAPEPMKRRELPSAPWEHLAIDFCGPLPSGHNLLVVVDYYSRYIEVEIMTDTTVTTETIKRLKRIFARFGLPLSIQADNGPQFISQEFEDFCNVHNIHLNNSIPYWPQQNGEVERQNRSIIKRLQISQAEKRNWIEDLEDYLLMYRSTPHSTTLKSPAELMFNRKIRDKLPSIRDAIVDDELVRDRDKESKSKGKEYGDDKRNAKSSEIRQGDEVLIKREKKSNKLATTFEPTIYKVVKRTGSEIIVENTETLSQYRRNVAHAKKYIRVPDEKDDSVPVQEKTSLKSTDSSVQVQANTPLESTGSNEISKTSTIIEEKRKFDSGEYSMKKKDGEETKQKRRRVIPSKYTDYVLKNVEVNHNYE